MPLHPHPAAYAAAALPLPLPLPVPIHTRPPPPPAPPPPPSRGQDGEVESFERLPVARVAELMATTGHYKENCCLVIVDFLVRHGYLTPDMRGYLELVAGLRSGDCS